VPVSSQDSPGENLELAAGVSVKIGDFTCLVGQALGMGSFGAVWAADGPDGSEVAIKEILCNSHSELLNALFESHLLKTLGGSSGGSAGSSTDAEKGSSANATATPRCVGVVPALLSCGTSCIGNDKWRVRLAMTRIPGEPLDVFLEERRRQHRKERREVKAQGGAGSTSIANLVRTHFGEACYFANELLSQLVPCFEQISASAFHRDVNSHNILVDKSGSVPRYGLVDFGLAVDSICWRSEEGSGPVASRPSRVGRDGVSTWHYLDVGGDCRYWPLSAWMQFLAGWRELEACPSLSFEYQMQLDLHALGITVMQILAELLPLPSDMSANNIDTVASSFTLKATEEHEALLPEVWKLRVVWERYWNRVSPLHGRLIDTFHNGGDWNVLKIDCIQNGVHDKLAEDLRLLRVSIREALDACRSVDVSKTSGEGNSSAEGQSPIVPSNLAGILAATLMLVSDGQGEEMTQGPYAWQVAGSLLASGGSDRAAPRPGSTMTASNCSTTASTVGVQENSRESASSCRFPAPDQAKSTSADGRRLMQSSSSPYLLLPCPRRVPADEGSGTPRRQASPSVASTWTVGQPTALLAPAPTATLIRTPSAPQQLQTAATVLGGNAAIRGGSAPRHPVAAPPRENLVCKLSDLKDKVDWLAEEMAKLGDKRGKDSHIVGHRRARC
jgi:serine/threonine protein kinase